MSVPTIKDVLTLLKAHNYEKIRSKGPHTIFSNGTKSIPIPGNLKSLSSTLPKGTFTKIKRMIKTGNEKSLCNLWAIIRET